LRLGAPGGDRTASRPSPRRVFKERPLPRNQLDSLAVGREPHVVLGALDELVETGDSATVAVA